MTRLLLVRHAQSEWNAAGRWQGQADPPLSTLGRRHALEAVLPEPVDVVVSSPLVRAHETALIIAAQLDVEVAETIAGLKERSAGQWTGLTRSEIADLTGAEPIVGTLPPGAEPNSALRERAQVALIDLAVRYKGQTVLVVTHGGVIGVINEFLAAHGVVQRSLTSNLSGSVVLAQADGLAAAGAIQLNESTGETSSPLE